MCAAPREATLPGESAICDPTEIFKAMYVKSAGVGRQTAMAAALMFTGIQFLLPVLVGSTMTWPFVTAMLRQRAAAPPPSERRDRTAEQAR